MWINNGKYRYYQGLKGAFNLWVVLHSNKPWRGYDECCFTKFMQIHSHRFVQGYSSCDCYRIYHWQLIDVFVYFSHHFVTIPPPCWTNAAHTHGVPVLGTLITENIDGIVRCSNFLKDTSSVEALVNQLVNIAEYYGFDGWLLNIENPIQVINSVLQAATDSNCGKKF